MSKLDGYFETPAVKGESVERENADGEFDLPTDYAARIIPFSGRLLCSGPAQVRQAANRLTGLLRGGLVTMQVTDAGGTTWAKVKRNGPTVPVKVNDRMLRFQFDVKAPDPRKFGDMNTFVMESGINYGVFHRGNYWATPKYTIRGSMPGGYTLHLAGKYFTVARPLTASAPHTIDFRNGRLYVGGALTSGGIAAAANLTLIGPGGVATAGIEPTTTGTAVATMQLLDTYI